VKTCKTCVWLDVRPDKRGLRVVRKGNVYRCTFAMNLVAWPSLPDSVTTQYSFSLPTEVSKRWMQGSDGTSCPTWSPLRDEKDAKP
jgi:hypothetical protein